tara:strand:+ start:321 stop:548 length:228 start_codon:yes stop_codon:yes gene_type:complete
MEWTKERLIKSLQYIIKSSESKEEAFEKTDYMFYEHLTRDDLVDIIIDFIAQDSDKELDESYEFASEKPDLKVVH